MASQTSELAERAFVELGGAAAGLGEVHQAVADRVFRFVGPGGAPVRVAHQAITRGVYRTLSGGARVTGAAAAAVAERGGDRAVSEQRRGAVLLGVLNGLIGDELEREGSQLHEPMSVRVDGRIVPTEREALAEAYPAATGRLVVFVHGLMETEHAWSLGAGDTGETYGTRLTRDLGCTPVYVRFNTGRHISENGRSLADLMERLHAAWPVAVDQIALVGHSMGGLVARSAGYQAAEEGARWVRDVRHVVSLGTPHMGAPLEQAVHVAAVGLSRLPETAPFGRFLRRRSAGIRDLRQGSLVDEDWRERDPDALRASACREIPLLDGAVHCFVSATVTRSPRHPIGRLLGDTLVLTSSASGRSRTRRLGFRDEHGLHVGGANHFALLNHPQVYERLAAWLGSPP